MVTQVLAVIGYAALAIWVAVIVHEVGHYLAGLAAGVPARAMRVRMEAPPHVDLGDGEVWLSPDDEEYVEVFRQYASSAGAAWLFVAGGFVLETTVTLAAVWLVAGAAAGVAMVVLVVTTGLLAVYLIGDFVASLRAGRPTGDLSALWGISRLATLVLVVAVSGLRGGALLVLI